MCACVLITVKYIDIHIDTQVDLEVDEDQNWGVGAVEHSDGQLRPRKPRLGAR